jgi:hypothetical protein
VQLAGTDPNLADRPVPGGEYIVQARVVPLATAFSSASRRRSASSSAIQSSTKTVGRSGSGWTGRSPPCGGGPTPAYQVVSVKSKRM